MNKEEKWQLLSILQYAGQHFVVEMKPKRKRNSGGFAVETRSKEVTFEEAKEIQDTTPIYFSKL